MQSSLYVGLSAQLALQRRLETVAHNVANASTVGFRAEEIKFESFLSTTPAEPVAFAVPGASYLSRSAGELVRTENPLDVALEGDAWLAIQTPAGRVYTRDGRMHMTENGELQTVNGFAVLDVGGAPILLDPNAGPPRIGRDGTITQDNRQIAALGLFTIPDGAMLSRYGNSGVITDQPAQPALDFTKVGVVQGYVERANVNPVLEMARLVGLSRAFDAVSRSMSDTEATLDDAIKTLGATS